MGQRATTETRRLDQGSLRCSAREGLQDRDPNVEGTAAAGPGLRVTCETAFITAGAVAATSKGRASDGSAAPTSFRCLWTRGTGLPLRNPRPRLSDRSVRKVGLVTGIGPIVWRVCPVPHVGFEVPDVHGGVSDAVRVLGLFRRPFHPEPIRGNGNASEPTKYHLQLLSR